ncbi:hypothetical protein ELS24_07405 [Achromobacter spanius]|uniref:hypothetical protein n=1 Tax=Achromobacter spanius TaxID=217203 RepID=UPI000F8FA6A0|nr:hypothetical protein [Achromobacter spanius]AZS78284.1 hypothetical protein ELS24_07405 [Achromobacter spanius]
MIPSARSPSSLAWRLALVAVIVRLVYAALVQSTTMFGLPQSEQMREMYSQPQYLMPMLTNIVASAVMIGLTVWGTMHGWLRRHDTTAVDEPRKLFGTFIALQLIYTLMVSAAIAYLHNVGMQFLMVQRGALTERFGIDLAGQFLAMGVLFRVVNVVLEIAGMFVVVRIATWTVQRTGQAGAPAYDRRHAAWNTGLTVLAWQLTVSIVLGGYLQMLFLNADWPSFVLGYLVLPALLLVLCTLVCLNILPRQMGAVGPGRAVVHGTIVFWLAQALGIGIGYLVIQAMSWSQLMRAAQSIGAGVAALAAYAALLAVGCILGKLALYRQAHTA